MSVLEMRRVSRAYGLGAAEVHALRDIDLTVDAGAMVAVMGPSGSGKSTLLTIAGSLEDASSGEVRVCGEKLSGLSRNAKARLRRRSIGYVFQDFNLLPGLTAAENVALPLELDGVSARKARAAGLHALDELGLLRGHSVHAQPLRDVMDQVFGARVARFHQRDLQPMNDELSPRTLTQLAGEAEVVRMDVSDQNPVDPVDGDLSFRQLPVQRLS